jgi:molybdopterin biosynthesis enzyme
LSAVLAELSETRIAAEPAWMPLDDAIGLVLDRDIAAPAPVPPRTIALIAGYAVSSASLVGASAYAPGLLTAEPAWVEPGRELPGAGDAVLPADAVVRRAGLFEVSVEPSPGDNVRRAGEDAGPGQVLQRRGSVLRPLAAAAAETAGIDQVLVRAVRVNVMAEPARLRIAMRVFAGLEGVIPEFREVRADMIQAQDLGAGDLIVFVGSDRDPAAATLSTCRPVAAGLALRGAETAMIGVFEGRPVVRAPPRLDTLLALRYGLLGPLFDAWNGVGKRPVWCRAPLARKLASTVGLAEVALLRETTGGLEPLGLGSLTLPGIAQAEGYLIVPPESEGFQAGETVEAFAL